MTLREWLLAAVVGCGLVVFVWQDLLAGGGLVGGDIYPYFFPQKQAVAESFAAGEIPLWQPLTGLGYPLHAESQAGVFYPTTQVLYRICDVHTAYHINVLLHYWLAYVFAWRFARAEGISMWSALLAALIFVYGWFPTRISWEWSIVGGMWLPLTLWMAREFVRRPTRRRFALLSCCLGIHLLAGHFMLAFINQLTALIYMTLRTWLMRRSDSDGMSPVRAALVGVLAILCAAGLAAVQLVPTYELKQLSQREGDNDAFDPAYGHMPPLYATQVVASWWDWHSAEFRASDRKIENTIGAVGSGTNSVEAHLYWGLLPFGLIVSTLLFPVRRHMPPGFVTVWWICLAFGMIYATGWLLPVTQYLPGFGFFRGPGRFTIMSAMGGALLAAGACDVLLRRRGPVAGAIAVTVIGAVTLPDLLWSAEYTRHAVVVSEPPLSKLDKSWVRTTLADRPHEARLLAPGPNVANLYGVSCVPQYLGIGPAIYYDDVMNPPTGPMPASAVFPDEPTVQQLRTLGITHVLTTEEVSSPSDELRLVSAFPDTLLNAIWGRGTAPCFLYELQSPGSRVFSEPAAALARFEIRTWTAQSVEFVAELRQDADVILRELMYPGWHVTVDEQSVSPGEYELPFRTVHLEAGQHVVRWTFAPRSFQAGMTVSILTGVLLLLFIVLPAGQRHVVTPPSHPVPDKDKTEV